ncbi:hypothetical protein LEN26_009121 [Aphanomyces euteiches]|nr:hypothetical protein AeMF1_006172 [Aphanomyces euteiches]KAH9128261.1 hypothetical protein LEN26_009121 [Aphanomyces euteiches]KAH9182381.1 hypothetical protein AeNC1_015641 [Aphanomyces euteiches]
MNFIGPIPQQVFFDTIASWTHGLLDLKDLLTLSMVSRSFYYTMNHSYWEGIVQAPKFQSMYTVAAFAKLNPRQRAIRIMNKRMCIHCRQIQLNEICPLRPHLEAFMVCPTCAPLPPYAEIMYTNAIKQYGLKRDQLEKIPSRKQFIMCGYRRWFKLKDVIELGEHEKQYVEVCQLLLCD